MNSFDRRRLRLFAKMSLDFACIELGLKWACNLYNEMSNTHDSMTKSYDKEVAGNDIVFA